MEWAEGVGCALCGCNGRDGGCALEKEEGSADGSRIGLGMLRRLKGPLWRLVRRSERRRPEAGYALQLS